MTGQLIYLATVAALALFTWHEARRRLPAIRNQARIARVRGIDTAAMHSRERGDR